MTRRRRRLTRRAARAVTRPVARFLRAVRWRIAFAAAVCATLLMVGVAYAPAATFLAVLGALYLWVVLTLRARLQWNLTDAEADRIRGPLVYLIRIGETGLVKIGMTEQENWRDRVRAWATGRPERLHVETLIRCRNPRRVEAALHAAFEGRRVAAEGSSARELFDLPAGGRWWRLRAEMVVARAR